MNEEVLHRVVFAALLLGAVIFTSFIGYEKRNNNARDVAHIGVMLALALVFGILESFLPDFLLPGMRIGLANVVTLFVLYVYGFKKALAIALLKALLVSMMRGNFLSMGGYMALTGSLLSVLGMGLLRVLWKNCSVFGVSIFGALLHVLGQIVIALIYLGTPILGYLPYLLLMAFGTGALVGGLVFLLQKNQALKRYLSAK